MNRPFVKPRWQHDHERARELAAGIAYEVEGELAFQNGTDDLEVTRELYEYVTELSGIVSRYYPAGAYDHEDDDDD